MFVHIGGISLKFHFVIQVVSLLCVRAVFLDKKTKCVVVSVRGTLSASDTVVDFWCENTPVPSSKESSGVSEMCHAGALMSAQGVFEEIMESGVLQALLDRGECPIEGGDLSVEWSEASSYDLMLVGHSLGGGIASLLSQVIRESSEIHTLVLISLISYLSYSIVRLLRLLPLRSTGALV